MIVALNVNGGAGGDAEGDTFEDIENLTGSIYADTLGGDDGVNELMGMDGNDARTVAIDRFLAISKARELFPVPPGP